MSDKQNTDKPIGQITLIGWTLSYPHLTETHMATPTSAPRYGAELRIPKGNTAEIAKVQAEIDRIKADLKKKKIKVFDSDNSFKDGDTYEKAKEDQKGHFYLSANRAEKQGPPEAYGKKRSAGALTLEATKKLFYPGCKVNAIVGIYFIDKGGNKICASLEIIQFAGDGERLGSGAQASAADLPDLEDDEADDLDPEIEEEELPA